jgi:4'-phosphopantetheinyl transferase
VGTTTHQGRDGAIVVWLARLDQPAATVTAAAALLSPSERTAAERGRDDVRRRRTMARAAMHVALAHHIGCAPERVRLGTGPGGKPVITNRLRRRCWFNAARSNDICVVAVTGAGPVGVDIEHETRNTTDIRALIARACTPDEAAVLAQEDDAHLANAFLRVWTRKEAYLKATGAGLAVGPQTVSVTAGEPPAIVRADHDNPRAWSLTTLHPHAGVVGALAVRRGTQPNPTPTPCAVHMRDVVWST